MSFQAICTGIEMFIFIYVVFFGSLGYNKIRSNDVRYLKKNIQEKEKVE